MVLSCAIGAMCHWRHMCHVPLKFRLLNSFYLESPSPKTCFYRISTRSEHFLIFGHAVIPSCAIGAVCHVPHTFRLLKTGVPAWRNNSFLGDLWNARVLFLLPLGIANETSMVLPSIHTSSCTYIQYVWTSMCKAGKMQVTLSVKICFILWDYMSYTYQKLVS